MKAIFNLGRLLFVLLLSVLPCVSAIPEQLPMDPAAAQASVLQVLREKGFTVLHQVEGSVSHSGVVLFQERWINLATREYKTIRLVTDKKDAPGDPLEQIEVLRAIEPVAGTMKTALGDLLYRPEEKRWTPVQLHTVDPHRTVFRRLTKEWYLGSDLAANGPPQCCGNGPAAAPVDRKAAYESQLRRIQSGKDPLTLKERPDGLLDEIKIRLNNETMFLVKNEYLTEYPVDLSAEDEATLQKARASRSSRQPPAPAAAANARGHGIAISSGNIVHIVLEGSPAARAGITPGDKLLAIDGVALGEDPVQSGTTLRNLETASVLIEKVDGSRSTVVLRKGSLGR